MAASLRMPRCCRLSGTGHWTTPTSPLRDAGSNKIEGKAVAVGNPNLKTTITREDGRTLYAMTMPKNLLGKAPFRMSLSVSDNDSDFLKQKLALADARGLRLILP